MAVVPVENNDFIFTTEVHCGTAKCTGEGRNKKIAKQKAAQQMYILLAQKHKDMRESGVKPVIST